jgi:CheY-like chemotaxis protein
MKGHIGADSVEYQGSCFWFEVPLKRIHEYETLPALTQLSSVLDNNNTPIPPILVLLVEDNPVNQKVASIMLEKLNCKVHLANHGEEALSFTERTAFNIIFMDCQMPVMDGLTATRNIRHNPLNLNQQTPIIALTANAFENDKKNCFESGMSDFISKPIHMNVLKDKLLQWHHQSHVDLKY